MNKGTAIVGFILCFIAGMGLMWGIDRGGSGRGDISADAFADGDEWSDAEAGVPVTSKDPMWGSRTAAVTMVVFSDFECPFCSRVEESINQLKEKYGPDKLRVLWKQNPLPFHKNGARAAIASQAVFVVGGNKAFWKFHEIAFKNQKALTDDNFLLWAEQAGVDKEKYKAEYAKNDNSKIEADMAIGKASGVTGTPATFINGVFLSGAQPFPKFDEIVSAQLAAAEAKLAAGVAKDKLYVEISKENKAKAPPTADKGQKPEQDSTTVWKVPAEGSPIKGNPEALVTIVEFSEFQCPFCSKVLPTTKQILDTYGDKVRIVWKNNPLPFHKRAEPAAELAMEARAQKGDAGFWEAHDLLFQNQKALEDSDLEGYAEKLGLDVAKVKNAIETQKFGESIAADQELAGDLQANGTPHFFINGRRVVGARPFDDFKKIIDEEITKSQKVIAGGVAAKDLYAHIIKDGKAPPPPEKKTVEPPPPEAPWKGGKDAKVTMQIWSDFECPFCKRVEATVDEVEKAYGNDLKIVWRHKPLPMHKLAPLASEASVEAYKQKGNDGFWKYHHALFEKAGTPDALVRESLDKYAEEQGLDMGAFKAALDSNKHKAFVDADAAAGEKAGIRGTPAFVIGDYFISGAQPFSKFKKLADMAMKEAGVGGAKAPKPDAAAPGGAPKAPAPPKQPKPPAPPAAPYE